MALRHYLEFLPGVYPVTNARAWGIYYYNNMIYRSDIVQKSGDFQSKKCDIILHTYTSNQCLYQVSTS